MVWKPCGQNSVGKTNRSTFLSQRRRWTAASLSLAPNSSFVCSFVQESAVAASQLGTKTKSERKGEGREKVASKNAAEAEGERESEPERGNYRRQFTSLLSLSFSLSAFPRSSGCITREPRCKTLKSLYFSPFLGLQPTLSHRKKHRLLRKPRRDNL